MSFRANVLKVLIASPGDTRELRDQVEQALHEWNGDRGEGAGVLLLPRRWETNAVPLVTGTDGQTVINSQLVANADIVIGIFHATLGRATPRAASGTAEELSASHAAGKPVHVYFSSMPIPRDHNRDQLAALDQFKEEMSKQGLYGSFDTPGSLKDQVKSAIEHDLPGLQLLAPAVTAARRGASLRAIYKYDREPDRQGRFKTVGQRLEIINDGDVTAEDVTIDLQPVGDGIAPSTWGNDHPFTLPPHGGTYAISVLTHSGTSNSATAVFHWTEDGDPRDSSISVSFR